MSYFLFNLNPPQSKKISQHSMFQMWVLQNHSNKINVYFLALMQVFHIELYIFDFFLIIMMQHCNMFQTHIFKENFNKILMQCSHSKYVNMIQM
jgi:hypothetical protein